MSTKTDKPPVLVLEPADGPSLIGERLARQTGRSWFDLRRREDEHLLACIMAALAKHQRRQAVGMSVDPSALLRMRVGRRRMLERLLLAYHAVTADAHGAPLPRALGLPPARHIGPNLAPRGVLRTANSSLGAVLGGLGAKGLASYPTGTPHPQMSATDYLAVLRGMVGGGGTPWGLGAGGLPGVRGVALLVGDRPNRHWARSHPDLDWPFISATNQGCSLWIAEQIETAGVPERNLHWIDAYNAEDKPIDGGQVWVVKPSIVIAMGKTAADWCRAGEVGRYLNRYCKPFFEVHHPQHWKQFHHGQTYVLTKILRRHFHDKVQVSRKVAPA